MEKVDLGILYDIVLDTLMRTESFPPLWRKPLIACAQANDPLFLRLKEVVVHDHLMPWDLLEGAKSVIVYFIPFRPEIGKDNSLSYPFASELWAKAYLETNAVIARINEKLSEFLSLRGYRSAVTPATHNFDPNLLLSRWSHKHIGFIAGLGTFGIHRLLITSEGCCGRLGSIVTDVYIEPSVRPNTEFCLEKRGTQCGKCASKCPVKAISVKGDFDRHSCYRVLLENDRRHKHLPLTDVCGQCSCEVPCSYRSPISQDVQEPPSDDPARC